MASTDERHPRATWHLDSTELSTPWLARVLRRFPETIVEDGRRNRAPSRSRGRVPGEEEGTLTSKQPGTAAAKMTSTGCAQI